jgi:hypothetical protein
MQLNVVFIATALLASASLGMSQIVVALFGDFDCNTDDPINMIESFSGPTCFDFEQEGTVSVAYNNVVNEIQLFVDDGGHVSCSNGAAATYYSGSGCANAPSG